MKSKPLKVMRKRPLQRRSIDLVDSVLEATKRVLINEGLGRATTVHVAEVAGVGVGSIYDYFSNKEGIFETLLRREINQNLSLLATRLGEISGEMRIEFPKMIEELFDF